MRIQARHSQGSRHSGVEGKGKELPAKGFGIPGCRNDPRKNIRSRKNRPLQVGNDVISLEESCPNFYAAKRAWLPLAARWFESSGRKEKRRVAVDHLLPAGTRLLKETRCAAHATFSEAYLKSWNPLNLLRPHRTTDDPRLILDETPIVKGTSRPMAQTNHPACETRGSLAVSMPST